MYYINENFINFTVGPVQMDKETLEIGKEQIPYFRTPEFSKLTLESEKLLCNFFDAPESSRVVFLTGSGTASMEGGVVNFFTKEDKVLVVNGGSFGERFCELCQIHDIPFTEIKLNEGEALTQKHLEIFENQNYTGFLVQACETSTGIKYDLNLIGEFCNRNNIFLFVDAVSAFMADEISMQRMNISAVITGSQKALSLPPSMSFTVLSPAAVERCQKINFPFMYFNYPNYLQNGERGQTPFTPAVQIMLQLNEKLKRIEQTGGSSNQNKLAKEKALYFREKIKNLPFIMFIEEKDASNCVTALNTENCKSSAYKIFEILKDEYNIWICPNGGHLKDKVFRVGHIGNISYKEIDTLIDAFVDLQKRNLI